MFITRKRFEEKLKEARAEGYEQAMKDRYQEEAFRHVHERIDRLADMINKPVTIPGFGKDVTTGA